jgi:3-keto-disaccharide hydrolase
LPDFIVRQAIDLPFTYPPFFTPFALLKISPMKKLSLWVVTLLFALALFVNISEAGSPPPKNQQKYNWTSLFDGKTLSGWHHVGDGTWSVEDGTIVGKTQTGAKLYGLLVSDKKYQNLKVRFKFKSIEGNSGFYVRGYIEKPDLANGLQCEVDPRGFSGGIYESYKRAWISRPTEEQVQSYMNFDQWNEMEITAVGGYVVTFVNGVKVAELLDDPVQAAGHLILQMHSGNKMLVYFKDIEIIELPSCNTK